MKKWTAFALCILLAAAWGLSGCGSGGEAATEAGGQPAVLRVGMAGKDIKTVCVILADKLGYYEEEGLDVQFETVASLNDGVTALSLNKLDVLPYGFVPSAAFISQGVDVVIIGGTIAEGSQAICRPEDAGTIKGPEDLAGKRIGFIRPETGQMIVKSLVRNAGLDLERDMSFIPMDGSASISEGISKGELDLGFVNSGYGYVAEKMGLAVAFDVGDYAPGAVCCRQTASREAADNKRDALVRFEIANLRAYKTYLEDHETTIALLMEYSGQDYDYVDACMYNGVMVPTLDPARSRVEELYQAMKENGDIDADTPYDIGEQVDISIYKDALDQVIKREPDSPVFARLLEEYAGNNGLL